VALGAPRLERCRAGVAGDRRMTTPALELADLHKSFGRTNIIRGVALSIAPGERHAIIGPNGAGKTTLFNLISGRLAPSAGEIRLGGRRIDGARPYAINRLGLSRSFQVTNVFPRLTVIQNLRCGMLWRLNCRYSFWSRLAGRRDVNARADELAERIGLSGRRDTQAGVLTYAELRALEIGVALGPDPDVLLLDEPTAGMSHGEAASTVELIRNATAGKALVMVEHDMSVVFGLADRISVLVYGKILATGAPEDIRANAAVQEAYLGQVEAS
jgi:branched-chain amino acid transport system ATP-binding protein